MRGATPEESRRFRDWIRDATPDERRRIRERLRDATPEERRHIRERLRDPDLRLELGDGSSGSPTDGTFATEATLPENVRALHHVNSVTTVDTFIGGATGTSLGVGVASSAVAAVAVDVVVAVCGL